MKIENKKILIIGLGHIGGSILKKLNEDILYKENEGYLFGIEKSEKVKNDIISENKFTFLQKSDDILQEYNDNREGTCLLGSGRDKNNPNNLGRLSKTDCESDNLEYTQEYTYSNTNYCKLKDMTYEPDEKLIWTGGELQSDSKDNWKSESLSKLNSSTLISDSGIILTFNLYFAIFRCK